MIDSPRYLPLTLALVALVGVGAIIAPVAAASVVDATETTADEYPDEPTFHVALEGDGTATLTLTTVYDLTHDDEREAFESLAADEESQAELLERFEDRIASVAADTGHAGDAVVGKDVTVTADDDRGIVALSVTWDELAAVEDDTLTLTEPFASGFETDQRLVVSGPPEASVVAVDPEPVSTDEATLTWDPSTSLSGFELVYDLEDTTLDDEDDDRTDETDEASETADDGTPGFGLSATLGVLCGLLGIYAWARDPSE